MKAMKSVLGMSFQRVLSVGALGASLAMAACAPTDDPATEAADDLADVETGMGLTGQIPVPKRGTLYAYANGVLCQFTVDGQPKGTATSLRVPLLVGSHTVACKRGDGAIESETVTIEANRETAVSLDFPIVNGELVAVAIGGSCAFTVNGAAKGTGTQLKLSVPPATYSVWCKPTAGGAMKSRTVIVKSGEPAMAMFKLN